MKKCEMQNVCTKMASDEHLSRGQNHCIFGCAKVTAEKQSNLNGLLKSFLRIGSFHLSTESF